MLDTNMYTMFAWFDVLRWSDGDADLDGPGDLSDLAAIQTKIDSIEWPTTTHIDFHDTNFSAHLVMHSQHNHGYGVPQHVDELITWLGTNFPGTHGLIYERDDEQPVNVDDNSYRVRVMVRGRLAQVPDPYFSPLNPTIET